MEIQSQSVQQTSGATPQSNTATSEALSSDFETFLLMMTTQMQNQDPLNPMESQEFALQLATFSGVEQQVRTNELLQSLSGGMGLTNLADLAGWVGMKARVDAPVSFDGAPVEIALAPDADADSAELIVSDNFGREISRQEVPLDVDTIEWVGIGESGQPLLPGEYNLQLSSMREGEVTSIKPVSHYADIVEARQGLTGIELVLPSGTVVGTESVSALRAADVSDK